ncbi:MAG: metallophosphoesterase family protein [Acidobacteriota bacterium]
MKIGFLSDAHGNSVMLAACLRKLRELGASSIYFLGDAVGYLPGEAEVLRMLRNEGVHSQKGNHEAMLLGELPLPQHKDEIYRIGAARERLSDHDRNYVKEWPNHRVLDLQGRKLLLVHGSPNNYLQDYVYPNSDLTIFDALEYDAVVMGHTHYPFLAQRHGTLVVNVGSCGLPRDQGDLPAFAMFDINANRCDIYRIQSDSEAVVDHFGAEQIAKEVYACLFRKPARTPYGQRLIKGQEHK